MNDRKRSLGSHVPPAHLAPQGPSLEQAAQAARMQRMQEDLAKIFDETPGYDAKSATFDVDARGHWLHVVKGPKQMSQGGIMLAPGTAPQGASGMLVTETWRVIGVGDGIFSVTGGHIPCTVEVGDLVILNNPPVGFLYEGQPICFAQESTVVCRLRLKSKSDAPQA